MVVILCKILWVQKCLINKLSNQIKLTLIKLPNNLQKLNLTARDWSVIDLNWQYLTSVSMNTKKFIKI